MPDETKENTNEELLDRELMSDSNKDHLADAQSITRKGIQLSNFRSEYAVVEAKIDLMSKLLGARAKDRKNIVHKIISREKDDEFKRRYQDNGIVGAEDYDLLKELMAIDQEIIPIQVILSKVATYGFKEAGTLVDVEATLKESKVFIDHVDKMLKNSYDMSEKIINTNKTILDTIISENKKRMDDDIKTIRADIDDTKKTVIKLDALNMVNKEHIEAVQKMIFHTGNNGHTAPVQKIDTPQPIQITHEKPEQNSAPSKVELPPFFSPNVQGARTR